jgi:hypothetical protein
MKSVLGLLILLENPSDAFAQLTGVSESSARTATALLELKSYKATNAWIATV